MTSAGFSAWCQWREQCAECQTIPPARIQSAEPTSIWSHSTMQRQACSTHLWPSCRGLKDPGRYTLPLLGASTITWPPEYSTDRTRPSSRSCRGSSTLCTLSCRNQRSLSALTWFLRQGIQPWHRQAMSAAKQKLRARELVNLQHAAFQRGRRSIDCAVGSTTW